MGFVRPDVALADLALDLLEAPLSLVESSFFEGFLAFDFEEVAIGATYTVFEEPSGLSIVVNETSELTDWSLTPWSMVPAQEKKRTSTETTKILLKILPRQNVDPIGSAD